MKIMTIAKRDPYTFDEYVNKALEEGYQIEHRAVLQTNRDEILHYAQLVQPDPAPEPEAKVADPFEALRTVKAACLAHSGPCNECPMTDWCERLAYGGDPTDWVIPEVGDV